MLLVKRFTFNPFLENTYIIYDDQNLDGAIIDPGCYDSNEQKMIEKFIGDNKIRLKFLINTHCHIDHIFGNAFIKEKYNPVFMVPPDDVFLLDMMIEQGKLYGTELTPSPKPDKLISEDSELIIGSAIGKFLFTPGHSPGEFCLYFESEKICFTGDVLFKGSIGRTDLWGGDYKTLIDSIRNKLFVLPDDIRIYPGHEAESTIGRERNHNPFFQ
ncbi:MAG TPA: MBL fold metallo-hydrolase [Melioribacteraceae bacterium]|nr:MBL fold metallo-hydrolase [Melioribacteraceae bacterium]